MKISIPQFVKEKKKSVAATVAVVVIAGFSFVAGKNVTESASPAGERGQKVAPTEPSREPASESKELSPKEDDQKIEREVDEEEIQIAHHLHSPLRAKHGSGHDEPKEKHTEKKSEKGDAEHASRKAHASDADDRGVFSRLVHTYGSAIRSVHDKIVHLHRSEEENHNLRIENAHLRVRLETQKYDCRVSEAKTHSETVGSKLNAQTGTRSGRTLASIQYQMPENLLPEQLHALGVSYMKAQDYEKGAAILTFLTELEDDSTFKKPENFILAGIAWYKLENFKNADQFFDRALKDPTASSRLKTQAKVWRAIVSQRTRNYAEAQEWLRRTLESDPQSKEAHWVNPQERVRMPASNEADQTHGKDEHEIQH